MRNFLSPASTDIDLESVGTVRDGMEWTFSHTPSAVSAKLLINVQFPVNDFRHFVWTCSFNGTFFFFFSCLAVKVRDPLFDDPHIIQIWFHTVIRASAYCDLKFMRQCNLTVAFIESPENLF